MEYPGGVLKLRTISSLFELLTTLLWKSLEVLFSAYVAILVVLPICTVSGLINEIYRVIASRRLRKHFGGRYELSSTTADNIWSVRKSGNSRNILLFTIFEDTVDVKTYKREFEEKVLHYKDEKGNYPYRKLCKIFTQAFGYCCWKEVGNFSIDQHIRALEPENKTAFFIESDLPQLLSDMSRDMTDEHPQWEDIIFPFVYNKDVNLNDGVRDGSGESIRVLKPDGKIRSGKIFRFHHAYMDHVSAVRMMRECMMMECRETASCSGHGLSSPNPPATTALEKAKELVHLMAFGSSKFIKGWMEESNCFSPFCLPQFSGRKVHAWSAPLDIKILDGIQRHTSCLSMEILSSALGGSLRLVSEKYCKKPPWLIFRDTFEDSVVLGLPSEVVPFPSHCPVNKIGTIGFLLNTEALASPLERLVSVRDAYRRHVAGSPVCRLHYWMLSFLGRFPCRLFRHFITESGPPVLLHQMPTFPTKVIMGGTTVEEVAVWMPLLNCTGLQISVCQYNEHVRICGVGETSRVTAAELDFIMAEIHHQIMLLAQECGLKS